MTIELHSRYIIPVYVIFAYVMNTLKAKLYPILTKAQRIKTYNV